MRELARRCTLAPGYSGSWSWSNSHTGEHAGLIGYRMEQDTAVLSYSLNGEPKTQRVPIPRAPCDFGNIRPWFACPHCAVRVAVIYLRRGGFYCRKCARVSYYSQSEDAIGRAWLKQRKAEAKLGKHWTRPKGMHASTRDKLLAIIFRCEEERDDALAAFVAMHPRWFKANGEPL